VCAKYRRPAGVTKTFKVCEYSIEPAMPNRARNLLSKDDWRAALADEPGKLGPDVPLVRLALALARAAEGLAGARACPNRSVGWPAGKAEGEGPTGDASEEVGLGVSRNVCSCQVGNAP
jgi:hypothetical protein